MVNIVQSVIAVGIIMLIGWLGRRLGMLPDNTDKVLTDVVYWFLAPAMLFSTIMGADLHEAIGKPFLVAIIAGLSTVVFFFTTAWLIFRPKLPDLTMGAMGAALNNAAMIGIPISTYVLGNGIHSVPIMLFQLGFLTPTFFVCADLLAADSKPTFKLVTKSVVTNPMLISAVLGFLVSWFQIPLPGLVTIPAELVGEAGSAVVLIAFGASIYGKRLRLSNRTGYMALYSTFGLRQSLRPADNRFRSRLFPGNARRKHDGGGRDGGHADGQQRFRDSYSRQSGSQRDTGNDSVDHCLFPADGHPHHLGISPVLPLMIQPVGGLGCWNSASWQSGGVFRSVFRNPDESSELCSWKTQPTVLR